MPGYKIFTRQDGQQIVKVYLDSRHNSSLIRQPYCYLSIEDFDLLNGSLFATKDLYIHKTVNGKPLGVHRIIVAKEEAIKLDSFDVADHINGVPLDNTRPNLRAVSTSVNANNRGYHFSTDGDDRRLGLDILELEMRGIISVEEGDKIYNNRIKNLYDKGIHLVDYLSFAFWFKDDDLNFYAPDLYDYIPAEMLRELVKNTYTQYHRLDILEYTRERKEELQREFDFCRGFELQANKHMTMNKIEDDYIINRPPESMMEQIVYALFKESLKIMDLDKDTIKPTSQNGILQLEIKSLREDTKNT